MATTPHTMLHMFFLMMSIKTPANDFVGILAAVLLARLGLVGVLNLGWVGRRVGRIEGNHGEDDKRVVGEDGFLGEEAVLVGIEGGLAVFVGDHDFTAQL